MFSILMSVIASLPIASAPTLALDIRILQVPAGFADEVGLDRAKSVLSSREGKLLSAVVGRERKSGGLLELARPSILVADCRSARVESGDGSETISMEIVPSIRKDGTVSLQIAPHCSTTVDGVVSAQTIETTATVPDSGTLIVRGSRMKNGKHQDLLFAVSVKIVR